VDVVLPEDPSRRITAQVRWNQGPNGISATWPGCVGRVEAGLDERTRTATVVVYVVNEPDSGRPLLDRNWFCEVAIDGKVLPEAFVLPRKAILPDESVYYVDAENRLRRKRIQIARYGRDTAVILPDGGLSAGDRVILQHVTKPVIGMTVTPLDELPTSTEPVTTGPASAGPDATAPTTQEARP
jgi:multidrug efflux pump subunit AcrA (membrane-fusion protein)